MKSPIAREMRKRLIEEESRLPAGERLRRSLEIGRRDIEMYMSANGTSREAALEKVAAERSLARRKAWARRNR